MSNDLGSQPHCSPQASAHLLLEPGYAGHRVLQLHHGPIHAERSYVERVARYVGFHSVESRAELMHDSKVRVELISSNSGARG